MAASTTPSRALEPVTKTIGGITFEDRHAWLQADSPEALAWQHERSQAARRHARSWPGFERLLTAIVGQLPGAGSFATSRRRIARRWFSLGPNDAGNATALRVHDRAEEPGRVLIDAAQLAGIRDNGQPVQLWAYEPSPDGRWVAFCTAVGGAMLGVWQVATVDTGDLHDAVVPTPIFNSPRPGWLPDGDGFFLADRLPDGRHHIRFVPVGGSRTPHTDVTFELDKVPASLPGLNVQVSPGGRRAVAVSMPHEHVALQVTDLSGGGWEPFLPAGWHGECHGDWLDDDTYVAIVTGDAPRGRVVAVPAATSTDPSTWRELVPPSDAVLRSLTVIGDRLVLAELADVALRVRLLHTDGTPDGELPLPELGSSPHLTSAPRLLPRSDQLVFDFTSFTRRPVAYAADLDRRELRPLGEVQEPLEGVTVDQRYASSADDTRIPYYLIHRSDLELDRPRPTLLHAYGGFNVALVPTYLGHVVPFLDAGGVYVHANLRGGSEYGREWYDAGRLHHKQRTFDDLYAVAEDIIAAGITAPEQLALHGASNGGLLAGVAIVQRPDLWRVVVPQVPLFDMLEPTAPGEAAAAVRSYYLEDYGDPDDPSDAAILHAYSPYHNVVDGRSYPAVLSVFGQHDVGCPPFHGRKFTARLQAASSSDHPVLLRVWDGVGHGSPDPLVNAEQTAEWLGFVMEQLGLEVPSPR